MKHLIGMLAAAAICLLGFLPAQASPVAATPPGVFPFPGFDSTTMVNDSFAEIHGLSATAGAGVTDNYFFHVLDNGNLSVTLSDSFPSLATTRFVGIDLIGPGGYFQTLSTALTSSIAYVFTGLLANNTYQLLVHYVSGATGASYNGTATLSSVPLPASWTLLLTAFGAIALVALYRRKTSSV